MGQKIKRLLLGAFFCLLSCVPVGKESFEALKGRFQNLPQGFEKATTAVFWSSYEEDSVTGRFSRVTAWARMPDKMVVDGKGQYTVAALVLKQEETSDGPLPDAYIPFLVTVIKDGRGFHLLPNEIFTDEGILVGWTDEAQRTVHFRGYAENFANNKHKQTKWEFKGRY